MIRPATYILVGVSLLAFSGSASGTVRVAQKPHSSHQTQSLASLKKLAGKYAVEKVLQHPEVRHQLLQLAGFKARKFSQFMKVQPPIDLTDGDLVAQGGFPHEVPDKCGVVVISFRENRVYAVLLEEGKMDVYAHGASRNSLPKGLTDWIKNQETPTHISYH